MIDDQQKREFIRSALEGYSDKDSICLFVNYWGLQVTIPPPKSVLCDVLIISESQGCHLLTFTDSVNCRTKEYSSSVGAFLKVRLVLRGGCTDKFGVVCHTIHVKNTSDTCSDNSNLPRAHMHRSKSSRQEEFEDDDLYPSQFNMNSHKFSSLFQALIICIAAYKPVDFTTLASGDRDQVLEDLSYFFLLTSDQFDLLWSQQFTKELWIHGPPGAGKTVAAVQLIQELRRRGNSREEVLYLAENDMLCSYVR